MRFCRFRNFVFHFLDFSRFYFEFDAAAKIGTKRAGLSASCANAQQNQRYQKYQNHFDSLNENGTFWKFLALKSKYWDITEVPDCRNWLCNKIKRNFERFLKVFKNWMLKTWLDKLKTCRTKVSSIFQVLLLKNTKK